MDKFELVADYKPMGDQIEAIKYITDNINKGVKEQILLGATGTGKTFTISNVIQNVNKPTLILAHNKTLAGQLYNEFKQLFPNNRVEYFISYYDYFQPEAYVPSRDLFIEKDSSINDEIDEMRHSATASLLERKDVIVVSSVSCIYGIGNPEDYKNSMLTLRVGDEIGRDNLLIRLVDMLFTRNDFDFNRGSFRVKGDVIEILPTYSKTIGIRVELFDDEIERVREFDVLTGEVLNEYKVISLFPATQFITNKDKLGEAISRIESELEDRIKFYQDEDRYLEKERITQRTNYDIEMLKEVGSCSGVENYSRHLSLRDEGETPYTLMDFFGDDYLLIVDESHVTLPQVRGMYKEDRSRKTTLVDYGFRLPSALDNRPLNFEEFNKKIHQTVYLSATPGNYEIEKTPYLVEQIIRPTGLLDPVIEVRGKKGQIDDIVAEILERNKVNQRTLITTLTIKMSEDLTNYLKELGIKVTYLHSKIKSLERIEIIRELRLGTYDVIIGINLLREGLDIPEVSLICMLDADKQGFLRSNRSLVQTIGRAARNSDGKVIMYADKMTDAMKFAISETARRREIQHEYNVLHNIIPTTIKKGIRDSISVKLDITDDVKNVSDLSKKEKLKIIGDLEKQMRKAAKVLDFELAAETRDLILELRATL